MSYRVREATLDDAEALVRHRIGMFTDMGVPLDAGRLERSFREWLQAMMPAGTYRAWVIETISDDNDRGAGAPGVKDIRGAGAPGVNIVAGGGLSVLPWPPGPQYMGDQIAVVYNVYTERAHRRQGLARQLMETIHAWCRDAGIVSIALNASQDGRPLYESMGYQLPSSPMMFFAIGAGYNPAAQASEKPTSQFRLEPDNR